MKIKKTIQLGKIAYTNPNRKANLAELELRLETKQQTQRTVDLEEISEYHELAITFRIWNTTQTYYTCCGAGIETLAPYIKTSRFKKILAIADKWHLNDMKAGTRAQNEAIKWLRKRNPRADYTQCCAFLEECELLIDNGYKYGSAWLVEVMPREIIDEVLRLFEVEPAIASI